MDFYVTAIAASGFGIGELEVFFRCIPAQPGIAFIVVSHLPRDKQSKLCEIVARNTSLPVQRVLTNTRIAPDHVYVLAENTILTVEDCTLLVTQRDPAEVINTSIDTLFASLAQNCKEKIVGIILGGMGADGIKGATIIEDNGGYVMVQKPDLSRSTEMARNVAEKNSPHIILPLEKMADHLMHHVAVNG